MEFMKLSVIKLFTVFFLAFGLLCNNLNAQIGECLTSGGCTGGTKYPSAAQSTTTDTWTIVSTIIYAGEYAVYNVTLGETYEWSLLTIDGGNCSYDSQLTLLSIDELTQYCYSDDVQNLNAKITWTATFTGQVRVLVNEYSCGTNSTATTLVWRCVSSGVINAPANDNCSGAVSLTVYSGSTCGGASTGDVLGATNSGISSCVGTANNDVWYKFIATSANFHDITVIGSEDFDAVIDLREGPSCSGTNITCSDNSGRGGTEIISANNLTDGETYYVRVYDYWSSLPSTTDFTICITAPSTCTPAYTSGTVAGDFVDGVELTGENSNSISNTNTGASASPYVVDYSSTHSADLKAGFSYALKLTNGTYNGQTLAAWIDYNSDGVYASTEKLGEFSNIDGNQSVTITFTVPAEANLGSTKMLVRAVWSQTDIDPCETYSYGEAEIYGIKIITPCITPAAPVSLSASSITDNTATISWSTGSPAGSPTITYYWAIGAAANVTYESNYLQRGYGTTLTKDLTTLTGGTQYYYTIKAVTGCNNTASDYAIASNFTTLCKTPGTPGSLSTTDISTSSAKLNWVAGSPVGSPTVKYYWAINTSSTVNYESSNIQKGITSDLNVLVYNLSLNTQYYWSVKAVTDCGSGSVSTYATAIDFTTLNIAAPKTWTGSTNTDWNTAGNWNPAGIPTVANNVIIPASCTRYPIITSSGLSIGNSTYTHKCKSLTINNGAQMTVGQSNYLYFSCSGDLNLSGTLTFSGYASAISFTINSGGKIEINNSGVLNIGDNTNAGDRYNRINLNGGELAINGGTVKIMGGINHSSGSFTMNSGELYVKTYGTHWNGSASNSILAWETTSNSVLNISGGTIYVCGGKEKTDNVFIDWKHSASNHNWTGGELVIRKKELSITGATDYKSYCNFADHSVYNLTINRSDSTNYIQDVDDNGVIVKGNLTITNGTLDATTKNIKVYGDWINNGTFAGGTGTTTLSGSNKAIKGANNTDFYNLIIDDNASYTIAPTTGDRINVRGNLTTETGSVLNIASNKVLDFYGATALINGNIIAVAANNSSIPSTSGSGGRDFDINNAASISGSGIINADLRIYNNKTTLGSNINLDGNLIIHQTTSDLDLSTYDLSVSGNWTNNGTFTAGTGSVFFSGASKTIGGTKTSTFYNLSFLDGSSYTLNPTTDRAEVDHTFIIESNSSLNLADGKRLSLRSSTNTINGNITTASTKYDEATLQSTGNFEIFIRRDNTLSGSGTIAADVLFFKDSGISSTTSLGSDITIDGSVWVSYEWTNQAKLSLGTHTLSVAGNWISNGNFDSGTGTVVFNPTDNRTIRTFTTISSGTVATANNFWNLRVEAASGKTVKLVRDGSGTEEPTNNPYSGHLIVKNNLEVLSGTFSTGGSDMAGRKLVSKNVTLVETGATLNIGGNSSYESGWGTYVSEFRGDIILHGNITSTRPCFNGYAEIFLLGARLKGSGNTDEFGCDVQIHNEAVTSQVSDVYIKGSLIIGGSGTLICESNKVLTIGGDFYVYHNLTHKGTVNVHGNMTSGTTHVTETVNINTSVFNFIQTGTKTAKLDKKIWFGEVNIKGGGTRTFEQDIDCAADLTIDASSTMDMYSTTPKNISLSQNANFVNNGTFVPYTNTVSFTGNSAQNITGSTQTKFYNLEINKTGSGVYPQNIAEVSNKLMLTNGIFYTSTSKYISLLDQSSVSPAGGKATSFVNGPVFKTGRDGNPGDYSFVFPTGKNGVWARIAAEHTSGTTANTDQFMAEYFDFPYPIVAFDASIQAVSTVEYWNLAKLDGNANLQKKVKLYSEDKNRSGITSFTTDDDLTVAHFNTTTQKWEDITLDASDESGSTGWVMSASNSNFSPFTFGSKTGDNPLPVSLLGFDAELQNKTVETKWSTASEYNTDYFIVQKSKDLQGFMDVGIVKAAGFSNELQSYKLIDDAPWDNISYYRLKIVDFDNTFEYSKIVAVNAPKDDMQKLTEAQANTFELISLYPNPVIDEFYVLVDATENTSLTLSITDISGKLIYQNQVAIKKGENKISLNASNFVEGFYILTLHNEKNRESRKFVKR
ncbi:MAG: GEVED domain-containing protein [Bacteroidales bacterium]|nr:GEVED domain-containing protein [Bacteroidales bacterium]